MCRQLEPGPLMLHSVLWQLAVDPSKSNVSNVKFPQFIFSQDRLHCLQFKQDFNHNSVQIPVIAPTLSDRDSEPYVYIYPVPGSDAQLRNQHKGVYVELANN